MTLALFIEQLLNGIQLGVMLFLMAAGLTLIFGVMGLINLAHGSFYMIGAFACAVVAAATGSFWLGLAASLAAAALVGALVEMTVIRRLYERDHLDQVLATFALILIFSEGTRWLFGSFPLYLDIPQVLSGTIDLPGGSRYQLYRMAIIGVGVAVAVGLYLLIARTRLGMRIRAGEADREMIGALGVDIRTLYTVVFALGAALAGLAGAMVGALQSVQVGMGGPVLVLAFVVIVIGGIGSIKGPDRGHTRRRRRHDGAFPTAPVLHQLHGAVPGHGRRVGAGVDADLYSDGAHSGDPARAACSRERLTSWRSVGRCHQCRRGGRLLAIPLWH